MYWKKNNKIVVDSYGRPISCTTCPCGSIECREAVDNEVTRLLNLTDEHGQYIWSMGETYTPQYSCAEWHYDSENEEWVLDHMAEGKLAVALRVGTKVSHTTDTPARYLVYAKTLYSSSLEQWITVGCECHITGHECKHRMVPLSDFAVAGLLDVWKPSESDSTQSYEPSYACEVGKCDLAKLKLQSAHEWHYGGTMHGEGYWDWWSDSRHRMSDYGMTKFIKALYWNDYETHETEQGTVTIDHWTLTYIPCACDSQYPSHHVVSDGEKIHSYNGICTLDSNCQFEVLWKLRTYLDEEASDSDTEHPYLWEEVASVATDFVCGTYDNNDNCITPSTGSLCIVVARPVWKSSGGVTNYAQFVTAVTIYNSRTGRYRTIGCQCVSSYRYPSCEIKMSDLPDYCIGGVLPVPPNCAVHGCAVMPCDAYSLVMDCYAEWYGCALYGEGYIQRVGTPFSYTKFWKCITGFASESDSSSTATQWYTYLGCACSTGSASDSPVDGVLQTGETIHELSGLCSNPECEKAVVLRQTAEDKGWTWHGEGFMAHLAYVAYGEEGNYQFAIGDWYAIYNQLFEMINYSWTYGESNAISIYEACAETPDGYWVVGCNCGGISYISKASARQSETDDRSPSSVPADYWRYFEMEGVCACQAQGKVPIREILLSYGSEFGLEEISYGNDSTFQMAYNNDTWCDTLGFRYEPTQTNNQATMYIDHRAFGWIGKCFWYDGTQRVWVRDVYPDDSPVKPSLSNWFSTKYLSAPWRIFTSASFNGRVTPFAKNMQIKDPNIGGTEEGKGLNGWYFKGMGRGWSATGQPYTNCGAPCRTYTQYSSMSQAQQECCPDQPQDVPAQVYTVAFYTDGSNGHEWLLDPILSPVFTKTRYECDVYETTPYPDMPWHHDYYGKPRWWSVGQELDTDFWMEYNIWWVETSKGFLVRGMGGYQSTFTVLGAQNYPHTSDLDYDADELKEARMFDDMGSCLEGGFDDWGMDDESESQSESSESVSVSQGE